MGLKSLCDPLLYLYGSDSFYLHLNVENDESGLEVKPVIFTVIVITMDEGTLKTPIP